MKTLLLLTALAATATAGPTFLGRDSLDQDSSPTGVLKTIKRERKSPIQESPSELFFDTPENSETLLSSDVRASSAASLNSGFKKPILVKKKFGYHIYRDSDEELAQAEPRQNCRRQFRFKVCDEDSDQVPNLLRNTQTEDIEESDVQQSLRMAKEAVEILQRDLLKIERSSKLTQRKIVGEKMDDKLHSDAKEFRKQEEILNEDKDNQWKTNVLHSDREITKAEEARTAEWKEAIEKIQKNVGIVKNNDNTLSSKEETNLLKSRNTDAIEATIAKVGSDLLSKIKGNEVKPETPKSAEENMETYATENKIAGVGLLSDSLKMEKSASLEIPDILRNVENDKSLARDTKPEDQRNNVAIQGKSSEKFSDSSDEVKLDSINEGDLKKNLNSEAKLDQTFASSLRSTSQENIEDKRLTSNIENLPLLTEDKSKDIESVQVKAASVEEIKDINVKENKMDVTDTEMSESRNSEILFNENQSPTIKENKEKSAMPWIPEQLENTDNMVHLKEKNVEAKNELWLEEKSIQRTANEKTETNNLNAPLTTTLLGDRQEENKNMREAEKDDEHLRMSSGMNDIWPKSDLHEPKEGDNKAIDGDIVEARNIATASLEESHLSTDDNNLRNTLNEEQKQWIAEPAPNKDDHVESSKLREAEDTDEKITVSNVIQARNVENEETETLVEKKKQAEEKSAAFNLKTKFDDALSKEINNEKVLFQKSTETVNEEKQKETDNIRELKALEQTGPNKHHNNKQDNVKERTTVDETKMLPFRESNEMHDHLKNHVGSQGIYNKPNMPSMKMSELDYYSDLGNQHTAQLVHDKNIDIHESSHLKDTVSDWNREKYYHNIRDPFSIRWPHDRMRMDAHIDSNAGHVHMHHHPENMHLEEDPHRFFPMGRFVNNLQVENPHEPLNSPANKDNMHENERASEWDIAMEPSMNMDMRHALDKHAMPWGYHRHAGFGSSIPLGSAGGPGAVGLFPNANAGCGIPLLLSCSPSVVSGSLAKSHSLRYNDPAFRSGDDMRFYRKRDTKTHEDKLAKNANNFFITSS